VKYIQFPLDQYLSLVSEESRKNAALRYGQILFNVLEENWPSLTTEIRGDENFDTYYSDNPVVISRLFDWLLTKYILIEEKENETATIPKNEI
jgi:hypothetical protein